MEVLLTGQSSSFTIELVNDDGDLINANACSYRVLDEDENELVSETALSSFNVGDLSVVVDVAAEMNTLAAGVIRGLRVIELLLPTDVGTVKISNEYVVESQQTLIEGVNSFQPYAKALLNSIDIANLDGWKDATKRDRILALSEAWRRIGQLRFRYVFDAYQNIIDTSMAMSDITWASPEQYAAMPIKFRESLRRAQVIEANEILGGDELETIRASGVMSMTIGESSHFFRTSKPLARPVCKRAMEELTKYIINHQKLTRT